VGPMSSMNSEEGSVEMYKYSDSAMCFFSFLNCMMLNIFFGILLLEPQSLYGMQGWIFLIFCITTTPIWMYAAMRWDLECLTVQRELGAYYTILKMTSTVPAGVFLMFTYCDHYIETAAVLLLTLSGVMFFFMRNEFYDTYVTGV